MMQRIDWACDSFALRPPSNVKAQTAALHWGSRLKSTDVGGIPKLTPLSVRGPHGNGSIVALSRLLSNSTHLISRARQGVGMMHLYPFAKPEVASVVNRRKGLDSEDPGAIRFRGKTCHLCVDSGEGPAYDLWHILFECTATCQHADIVAIRHSCIDFLSQLCHMIDEAVRLNGNSISNTMNAGVSHDMITAATVAVREAIGAYQWDCTPGRWLMYTLLLALPFAANVVRPDTTSPIWLCKPKRLVKGVRPERDSTGMPLGVPDLPDEQYRLPLLVGHMFDCTILAGNALRPIADQWCRHAANSLLRAGRVVCPLREAAEKTRAAARALAALEVDGQSTTSSMSSSDSDESTADSTSEP